MGKQLLRDFKVLIFFNAVFGIQILPRILQYPCPVMSTSHLKPSSQQCMMPILSAAHSSPSFLHSISSYQNVKERKKVRKSI